MNGDTCCGTCTGTCGKSSTKPTAEQMVTDFVTALLSNDLAKSQAAVSQMTNWHMDNVAKMVGVPVNKVEPPVEKVVTIEEKVRAIEEYLTNAIQPSTFMKTFYPQLIMPTDRVGYNQVVTVVRDGDSKVLTSIWPIPYYPNDTINHIDIDECYRNMVPQLGQYVTSRYKDLETQAVHELMEYAKGVSRWPDNHDFIGMGRHYVTRAAHYTNVVYDADSTGSRNAMEAEILEMIATTVNTLFRKSGYQEYMKMCAERGVPTDKHRVIIAYDASISVFPEKLNGIAVEGLDHPLSVTAVSLLNARMSGQIVITFTIDQVEELEDRHLFGFGRLVRRPVVVHCKMNEDNSTKAQLSIQSCHRFISQMPVIGVISVHGPVAKTI